MYAGATHYVYPGANHTRFEHSIGWASTAIFINYNNYAMRTWMTSTV